MADLAAKKMPSQERLRELFIYDPETGRLFWRRDDQGKLPKYVKKEEAGGLCNGYLRAHIKAIKFPVHRLVWKYVYGVEPTVIDHINGNPLDNRVSNLRDVDAVINQRNRKINVNNSTGVSGISFEKNRGQWTKDIDGRWSASIGVGGKAEKLGHYETFREALSARQAAERVLKYVQRVQP